MKNQEQKRLKSKGCRDAARGHLKQNQRVTTNHSSPPSSLTTGAHAVPYKENSKSSISVWYSLKIINEQAESSKQLKSNFVIIIIQCSLPTSKAKIDACVSRSVFLKVGQTVIKKKTDGKTRIPLFLGFSELPPQSTDRFQHPLPIKIRWLFTSH